MELRECDKEAVLEGEGEEPDPVTMDAVKLFKYECMHIIHFFFMKSCV